MCGLHWHLDKSGGNAAVFLTLSCVLLSAPTKFMSSVLKRCTFNFLLRAKKFCRTCVAPVSRKNNRSLQVQLVINNTISCWVFVHGGEWLPDFSGVMVDGSQVLELFRVRAVNHRPDAEIWRAFLWFLK